MTTAAPLAAVPDSEPGSPPETIELSLRVQTRDRGKLVPREEKLRFYPKIDGGAYLRLGAGAGKGGMDEAAGTNALIFRALVDDDGVPHQVTPRLMTDDEAIWPDDDDDEDDEADAIPADAELGKLAKSELVALAERFEVDPEGTKDDLKTALRAKRDEPSTEVVTTDDEAVEPDATWRLVWPDRVTGAPSYEIATDANGDDFGAFDSLVEARAFALEHGSSMRRFIAIMDDPYQSTEPQDIGKLADDLAAGAAGRPTGPSRGSRRSRSGRARSRR